MEQSVWPLDDNPLCNAPHTMDALSGEWPHPYSRKQACFPLPWLEQRKFWPSVGRVDNVYGDRHLVCSRTGLDADASQINHTNQGVNEEQPFGAIRHGQHKETA